MLNNKTLKDNNEICLKCEYQKPIKLQLIKMSTNMWTFRQKKSRNFDFSLGEQTVKPRKLYLAKNKLLMIKILYLLFWFVIYRPKYPSYVGQLVIQLFKLVPIYKNFCEVCLRGYHGVAGR